MKKLNELLESLASLILIGGIVGSFWLGLSLIESSKNDRQTLYKVIESKQDTTAKYNIDTIQKIGGVTNTAYEKSFNFFLIGVILAVILALLPRIQSISGGGFSLTLKEKIDEINKKVETLKDVSNQQQNSLSTQFVEGKKGENLLIEHPAPLAPRAVSTDAIDPQKGRWGGRNESNGRRLSVTYTRIVSIFYRLDLKVESLLNDKPLSGTVNFHLHDTFMNQNPTVFVKDGIALLSVTAYGAFTVGVEADNGETQLELDLTDPKWGLPEDFRNR